MGVRFFTVTVLAGAALAACPGASVPAAELVADLSGRMSGPTDGQVGQTLAYSLAVTNAGPSIAEDVVARINVPPAFTVLDASFSQGFLCNHGLDQCPIGQIASGQTITGMLTVRLGVRERAVLSLGALSPTSDPNSENNTAGFLFLGSSPPARPPGRTPVVLQSKQLSPAMVGRSYSAQILATGGTPPYRFAPGGCQAPMPAGLTLSEDGRVSGSPTVAGNAAFCLRVFDSSGSRFAPTFTMPFQVLQALELRPLSEAVTGTRYADALVVGGQPPYKVTFTGGGLPPDLNLTDGATRVSGTPVISGPFSLNVHVEDSFGFTTDGSQTFHVRVGAGRHLRANPKLTPGRLAGRAQCRAKANGTIQQARIRPAVRARLLDSYGVRWEERLYVIDHLIPIELGGHPTHVANLWPQLAARAKRTDVLERYLVRRVCAGEMPLRAAQKRIKTHKLNIG